MGLIPRTTLVSYHILLDFLNVQLSASNFIGNISLVPRQLRFREKILLRWRTVRGWSAVRHDTRDDLHARREQARLWAQPRRLKIYAGTCLRAWRSLIQQDCEQGREWTQGRSGRWWLATRGDSPRLDGECQECRRLERKPSRFTPRSTDQLLGIRTTSDDLLLA